MAITVGSILDYVNKTIIQSPNQPLNIGELGRVMIIQQVATVTNPNIQIITDKNTTLTNLSLAFKYGLNQVSYLEQQELDLEIDGLEDYFTIVLSGFQIDPLTFSKGKAIGVILTNQSTIDANTMTSIEGVGINYSSDSKLSIIQGALYASNMIANVYTDLQYFKIDEDILTPSNIGEAELLKDRNINFVYHDEIYGKRLALSRIGGVSGYKPYLQYKIVKEIKYNNFDFVYTNKPYNTQTLISLLETKQLSYVEANYADVVVVDSLTVNNDLNIQTWKLDLDFEIVESIWFFNLIVRVI